MLHNIIMTSVFTCLQFLLFLVCVKLDAHALCITVHVQQLNYYVKKCQTLLCPICDLETAQISILWITRSGLSCSIVSTRDKSLVWMNWNVSLLMSVAVLNSWFLTGLWPVARKTSSMCLCWRRTLRVQPVDWQCWFCPYLLHSMWLVWLLHVYEIMPAMLANTFLFILQGNALADLRYGGRVQGILGIS